MYDDFSCPYCDGCFDYILNGLDLIYAIFEDVAGDENNGLFLRLINANQLFVKMLGFTNLADIIGKSDEELFTDNFKGLRKLLIKNTEKKQESFFSNADYFCKRYCRINSFSPEKDIYIVIFNDITSLKQSEENNEKHKLLVDCAQDIILYVNEKGKIIDINDSACKIYGYSRDELVQMSIHDIRHSSAKFNYEDQMEIADQSGTIYESVHVKKDGTYFPVEVSAKGTIIENEHIRIHIIRDITDRKAAEEKIKYFANFDALTQISNRGYLISQLEKQLHRTEKQREHLSVLFFDVDKFKLINDVYGHTSGDKVLQAVASKGSNILGTNDFIGRLGGDEFVILHPFSEVDDTTDIVNRLFQALQEPVNIGKEQVTVTISVGISIFPQDGDDVQKILKCADKAMYQAKRIRGNSYISYGYE